MFALVEAQNLQKFGHAHSEGNKMLGQSKAVATSVLSLMVSLSGLSAHALAVKHDPVAARGCIPMVSLEKANEEISKYNLRTVGAKPEELKTLGTGLFWLEKLDYGQPLDELNNAGPAYTITFADGSRFSHRTPEGILIHRNGYHQFGRNEAQIIHEIGHQVGRHGAYEEYIKATRGQYCIVSGYSGANSNEQFAEVFAAFVTKPSLIRNNGSVGCKRAYKYFSENLFANGELAGKCAVGKLTKEDYKY